MARHLSVAPGMTIEAGNKGVFSWRSLRRSQKPDGLTRRLNAFRLVVDEINQLSKVALEIYK